MDPFLLVLEPYQFSEKERRIIKDLRHVMVHSGNLVTSVPQVGIELCNYCTLISREGAHLRVSAHPIFDVHVYNICTLYEIMASLCKRPPLFLAKEWLMMPLTV